MSAARTFVHTLALALLATPAAAQQPARDSSSTSSSASWLGRVSVTARLGQLRPSGRSELFALMDRALLPTDGALRPRLTGGELHVALTPRFGVLLGAESGRSTVASVSRAQATGVTADVRQQTTLDVASLQYVGMEWQAFRWRGTRAGATDRVRLLLGAGGGVARYRLHQWGDFVDAPRSVAYADDFGSAGRGGFGYGSATLEVPVRRWIAVQGDVRRQVGSAPMSADFAAFDRLDLGGTRLGVGLRLRPAAMFGAR
ncbi:hypothetical protein [Roseisolibacter agri]|uniref:MltA-interacting protein MipA n=1 Tax=Roseisolibacter agri TaxID=2014610 RepID=A0AA37V1X0_9BACT|nr:hypothetical protein [Roseisolibacter agri]GLC26920.1 hypothetical protein rosag_34330 [Roseisolibacter agri]